MTDDRLLTGVKKEADAFEATIRPQSLDDFTGQEQARDCRLHVGQQKRIGELLQTRTQEVFNNDRFAESAI